MKTAYSILLVVILAMASSCQKEEFFDYQENNTNANNVVNGRSFLSIDPTFNLTLESRNHNMGGFASQQTTLFKDNIWLVGGDNSHTLPYNSSSQVWRSPNGKDWKLITSGIFEERHNHSLIVYKNKMWLIGGINNSGEVLSDIWNTSDGVHWTRVRALKPFNDIGQNSSVVFNNRIFVFRGNGSVNEQVWSSSDGMYWRMETANAFPSRAIYKTVVFNNKIFVIGGVMDAVLTNEVWASKDGRNWSRSMPIDAIFEPRIDHTATVYRGKVWVIGGLSWNSSGARNFHGDIWYSKDMKHWSRYDGKPPFYKGLEASSSLVYKNKLWVFGGYRPNTIMESIITSSIYSIE